MKNEADYSEYKCPYSHIEKECGHALMGPEGFKDTHGVWCACGFRGPVFVLDPDELKLDRAASEEGMSEDDRIRQAYLEGWEMGWVSRHVDTRNDERVCPDFPPKGQADTDWHGSEARGALTPKQVADR